MDQKITKKILSYIFKDNNTLLERYNNDYTINHINKNFTYNQKQSIINSYET